MSAALTTTYTPAASCQSALQGLSVLQGAYPFLHGPVTTDGCFPDKYGFSTGNYFSPGICPVGYTSACTRYNSVGTVTETVVTCCPTSYSCNVSPTFGWEDTYVCASYFSGPISFPSITVLASAGPTTSVSTDSVTLSEGTTSAFNAFGIQIRFQSTDFAEATSAPSASATASSVMASATASSALATSSSGNSSNGDSSNGLSTSAAVGIGVGCAIACLLVGTAFLAFRYGKKAALRKAQARSEAEIESGPQSGYTDRQAGQVQYCAPGEPNAYVPGNGSNAGPAATSQSKPELPGEQVHRVELP